MTKSNATPAANALNASTEKPVMANTKSRIRAVAVFGGALIAASALAALAAGCDDSTTPRETVPVAPVADSGARDTGSTTIPGTDGGTGTDAGPLDCFPDPKTHEEIINRCSNSEKIDKNPTLPLLYADGGLPPLPN